MANIPQSSSGVDPAYNMRPITPSDSVDQASPMRAIYVGVAGDVVVTSAFGVDVTFKNCPAGLILPVRASRVKATGTTATNLVALW